MSDKEVELELIVSGGVQGVGFEKRIEKTEKNIEELLKILVEKK